MTPVSVIRHDRRMTIGPAPVRVGPPSRLAFGPSYEDFVGRFYRALLALGVPTRGGLHSAGFQDEDITVGIGELVARGFIRQTPDPDCWEVVPPRTALGAYAADIEQRLGMVRASTGALDQLWRRAVGVQHAPGLPPEIDLLVGTQDIAQRIRTLLRSSTQRVWWAVEGSRAAHLLLQEEVRQETGLLEARPRVDVRLMMDTSLLQDDAAMALLEGSARAGHQVRVRHGIPFSLVLGDTTALLDLTAFDRLGQGSVQTQLPPMVAALARLLEEIFALSTSYGEAADALATEGGPPLDERDRQILALLTVGTSDQAVARQIGVSVRTVERRVRLIMDNLGTATRFQAGVQAVRRGWV